ncbi:hypothetical protein KBY76_09440 [Synechococcus sp. GreenBA-s]|nr:hypothetical protein [Synechococcus sp. GreenBA-s]
MGLPLVAVGLALLTGSIATAGQILVFSVICTLGIGALFWLGLALVLGLATLYAADQIARLQGRPAGLGLFPPHGALPGAAPAEALPSQGLDTLSRYAARRLAQGGDRERIRHELLRAGWSVPQVEAALRGAGGA